MCLSTRAELRAIVAVIRPKGQPLMTVANHACTLDDPGLMAALMPWSVLVRPTFMRWAVCSQEICFNNAPTAAFFGGGKVGYDGVVQTSFFRTAACLCQLL